MERSCDHCTPAVQRSPSGGGKALTLPGDLSADTRPEPDRERRAWSIHVDPRVRHLNPKGVSVWPDHTRKGEGRPSRPTRWPSIRSWCRRSSRSPGRSGRSAPSGPLGASARAGRRDSRLHLPTAAGFVAVDGDRAVATVQLHEFEIDAIRDRSPWVCGMVVRPEYRGAGVGRRLLVALEQFAARHGGSGCGCSPSTRRGSTSAAAGSRMARPSKTVSRARSSRGRWST